MCRSWSSSFRLVLEKFMILTSCIGDIYFLLYNVWNKFFQGSTNCLIYLISFFSILQFPLFVLLKILVNPSILEESTEILMLLKILLLCRISARFLSLLPGHQVVGLYMSSMIREMAILVTKFINIWNENWNAAY